MKISKIDAVIFDLDGVITNSTPLHSFAWKQTFDQFLKTRAEQTNTPFREFTHEEDYLSYVDGKPRYIGVKSFLESRSVNLPRAPTLGGVTLSTIPRFGYQTWF